MNEPAFFMPGQSLSKYIEKRSGHKDKIVIGPGIHREASGDLVASCAARIHHSSNPDAYWLDGVQTRYQPVKGERVLGIVLSNRGQAVKVDIGTTEYAMLNVFLFEGATKKNRPDIKIGDLVFARLLAAGKDVESELACVNSKGKKEGLGVLPQGGYMFNVPAHVARKLLHPENNLIKNLGSKFKFESAIGMNGRIWVKGNTTQGTIYIMNAITRVRYMTDEQLAKYSEDVLETFTMIKQ